MRESGAGIKIQSRCCACGKPSGCPRMHRRHFQDAKNTQSWELRHRVSPTYRPIKTSQIGAETSNLKRIPRKPTAPSLCLREYRGAWRGWLQPRNARPRPAAPSNEGRRTENQAHQPRSIGIKRTVNHANRGTQERSTDSPAAWLSGTR